MRELKFRAWDRWLNKMVYQHDMNVPLENKEYLFSLNEEGVELMQYDEDYSAYITRDANIMQYTGIKDCNGKEIYEDDIVKVKERIAGEDFIGKVIYDKTEGCYWIMQGDKNNCFKTTFNFETYEHYVIGNIYENPELLD